MIYTIRLLGAVVFLFGAHLCSSAACAQSVLIEWTVSEFQPDLPTGGRANTIAVNPTNSDQLIVASESGGLFRSTDRGVNWKHIDALPEFTTFAVAYVPADPSVVIATVGEDTRVANGGGIWRSTDGGLTWTQMPGASAPAGVTERLSAYDISIAPDNGTIYVGTQYGVSISQDRGATWTHVDVFGTGVRRVLSVLGQTGNHVLAAGPEGISRSSDGGATWIKTTMLFIPGKVFDIHALAGSPFSADQAYVMNQYAQLFYTEDGGNSWTWITPTPVASFGCGGIPFVKAIGRIQRHIPPPSTRSIDLYVGNRCRVSRLSAPEIPGTGKFDYSGAWTTSAVDHLDTRDLAFTRGKIPQPLLLATDGGLHKTTNGGLNWTFTGGGIHGYNALQINEVRGQWITSVPGASVPRYDLYFGTQDNGWSTSSNLGAWSIHTSGDVFYIENQHRVATAADSKTTFSTCGPCDNWVAADPLFTGNSLWPDPASPRTGAPKIVRKSFHVEAADSSAVLFGRGLAVTTNLGSTWSQYALFPEDWRDLPKLSDPGILPVLYQSVRTGFDAARDFEINQLVRIDRSAAGSGGSASYPLMNNFGGLGISPVQLLSYQVFAVDPGNAQHLIAPDVVNEKMMATMDGGNNWSEIAGLTSQITGGGQFLFRNGIVPQASAISFSPDDPNMVAIGTWQAGMFVSADRGATWYKIPDTDPITRVTSIAWRTANDAIVSTYGRGLWRIRWRRVRPLIDLEKLCKAPCIILPIPPVEEIEELDLGVLVFGGPVQGARGSRGILRELFISPGSSVIFFGDARKGAAVKVTESRKRVGLAGVKLPKAPERNQLVGLTLGARGTLTGAVFSDKTLLMYEPSEIERNPQKQLVGRQGSPTAGKPYLTLTFPGGSTSNGVGPEGPIRIAARNFQRGALLEIALDQKAVERVKVGEDGAFAVTIKAPQEFGLHTVTARDATKGNVIDGANFIVSAQDKSATRR